MKNQFFRIRRKFVYEKSLDTKVKIIKFIKSGTNFKKRVGTKKTDKRKKNLNNKGRPMKYLV